MDPEIGFFLFSDLSYNAVIGRSYIATRRQLGFLQRSNQYVMLFYEPEDFGIIPLQFN